MRKRKGLSMGWFGWTLTSVVAVTLIGSSLFFFNILDLNSFSAAGGNDDKGTEKMTFHRKPWKSRGSPGYGRQGK